MKNITVALVLATAMFLFNACIQEEMGPFKTTMAFYRLASTEHEKCFHYKRESGCRNLLKICAKNAVCKEPDRARINSTLEKLVEFKKRASQQAQKEEIQWNYLLCEKGRFSICWKLAETHLQARDVLYRSCVEEKLAPQKAYRLCRRLQSKEWFKGKKQRKLTTVTDFLYMLQKKKQQDKLKKLSQTFCEAGDEVACQKIYTGEEFPKQVVAMAKAQLVKACGEGEAHLCHFLLENSKGSRALTNQEKITLLSNGCFKIEAEKKKWKRRLCLQLASSSKILAREQCSKTLAALYLKAHEELCRFAPQKCEKAKPLKIHSAKKCPGR